MIALAVWFCVALSWVGNASCSSNSQHNIQFTANIVNGTKAPDVYPYMVSFQWMLDKWEHICGGSIISKRHVITAAHCTVERRHKQSIWAGTTKLNGANGQRFAIESIRAHPDFDINLGQINASDIAILKTALPFVFSDDIEALRYSSEVIGGDEDVVLTGWGNLKPNQVASEPNDLQQIKMKTQTNQQCIKYGRQLGDMSMCTKRVKWRGACHGDSGSPLVARGDLLVGVASISPTHCGVGKADVFVRISTFYKWIRDNTKV